MVAEKTKIRIFVVENFLFGDDADLTDETSFLETGIVDSTGILELVEFLEQEFHIQISDEELLPENLDSITQIASFLLTKIQAA